MRGRGRGRGRRGGRGRSAGRRQPTAESKEETRQQDVDIDTHPREFFVGVVSTEDHLKAQEKNRPRYAAALAVLQKNKVSIAQSKLHMFQVMRKWVHREYITHVSCNIKILFLVAHTNYFASEY